MLNCKLCQGTFTTELAYYYHNFRSHKPKKECLDCKVCGKTARNIMNFKRHILITHGGYTHTCPICGKRSGHFSKTSREDNLQQLIEKARTSFKMHMITYHDDGQEGPHSIAR